MEKAKVLSTMCNLHFLMEMVNNKNEMPNMQKENNRKNKQKPSHNLIKRSRPHTINAYNHQQLETTRISQWLESPTPLPSFIVIIIAK
jgi:hypothetical protein